MCQFANKQTPDYFIHPVVRAIILQFALAYDHPFVDGNGRVARLMSHAVLLETLDTGAVWSVARGLARNVEDYKKHLAACDRPAAPATRATAPGLHRAAPHATAP